MSYTKMMKRVSRKIKYPKSGCFYDISCSPSKIITEEPKFIFEPKNEFEKHLQNLYGENIVFKEYPENYHTKEGLNYFIEKFNNFYYMVSNYNGNIQHYNKLTII